MRFVCAVPVGWGLLLTLCAVGLGALVVAEPALRWGINWLRRDLPAVAGLETRAQPPARRRSMPRA